MHSPPRILLAEDDPHMRSLVVEALRADGYDVVAVENGERLLIALAHKYGNHGVASAFDLVISDIRMPVRSGMEILEQIRFARCATPVILMTAFGDAAARARASSFGALVFDKPFDLDDLRAAVANLLPRNRQPR
jgi:DNA-binding response OmpR family regulator